MSRVVDPMVTGLKFTLIMLFSRVTLLKDKLTAGDVVSLLRVKFTKDPLVTIQCAVRVFTSGLMVDCSSDHSKQERKMVKEPICGLMDRHMMVNSRTMTAMASAFCITQMVSVSKVTGRMVKSTAKATISGPMALSITVYMLMVKRKIKAS